MLMQVEIPRFLTESGILSQGVEAQRTGASVKKYMDYIIGKQINGKLLTNNRKPRGKAQYDRGS